MVYDGPTAEIAIKPKFNPYTGIRCDGTKMLRELSKGYTTFTGKSDYIIKPLDLIVIMTILDVQIYNR